MKNRVDPVYYDNLYNICKIYLDDRGCPSAFEFYDKASRNEALELVSNLCLDPNGNDIRRKFYLSDIFKYLQLIIDDYNTFKSCFTCLTKEDLLNANKYFSRILVFDEMEVDLNIE